MTLRIISGRFKATHLASLEGGQVRPTSGRNREAIFNSLVHAPWSNGLESKRVLDLFCGTGAMGLEALSRGASFACFVDQSPDFVKTTKNNINRLKIKDHTQTILGDATSFSTKLAPFDIIFIDPPYGEDLISPTLSNLLKLNVLAPNALIILEMGKKDPYEMPKDFAPLKETLYGKSRLIFLSWSDPHGTNDP